MSSPGKSFNMIHTKTTFLVQKVLSDSQCKPFLDFPPFLKTKLFTEKKTNGCLIMNIFIFITSLHEEQI